MHEVLERLTFALLSLRPFIFGTGLHLHAHYPALRLVHLRMGRMLTRLRALHARWLAGRDLTPRPRRKPAPSAPPAPRKPRRPLAETYPGHADRWPSRQHWLLRTLGSEINPFRGQIALALAEPAMATFLAEAPQAARILRPWVRLLSIEIPVPIPALQPLPRKRKPRPPKLHHHRPRKTEWDRKYWKPHTGPYPGVPDRHRLKIPGINAPRLPEDRPRRRSG